MLSSQIIDRLEELALQSLEGTGTELVAVEAAGSRQRPVVRVVVIARDGSVSVEDCAAVSRRIEKAIEGTGLRLQRYVLEVSSPGLDRELKNRREFEIFAGRDVRIEVNGEIPEEIIGRLEGVKVTGDETYAVRVRVGETERTIPSRTIGRARLHVDWEAVLKGKA